MNGDNDNRLDNYCFQILYSQRGSVLARPELPMALNVGPHRLGEMKVSVQKHLCNPAHPNFVHQMSSVIKKWILEKKFKIFDRF